MLFSDQNGSSRTYLAHHELESVVIITIIVIIITIVIITVIIIIIRIIIIIIEMGAYRGGSPEPLSAYIDKFST